MVSAKKGKGGIEMVKTFKNKVVSLFVFVVAVFVCMPAWAKPRMEINITTSKVVIETVNGDKVKKLVPTKEAFPGDTLVYTIFYSNKGNEAAKDAVIENPVPKGASYIADTVVGNGSEVSFSVDDGKSFARPELLMSEVMLMSGTKVRHPAAAEDYTHVRWTIRQVPPGGSGKVGFSILVK